LLHFVDMCNFAFWLLILHKLNNHLGDVFLNNDVNTLRNLSCRNVFVCKIEMQEFFRKYPIFLQCEHISFFLGREGEMLKESQVKQEHLRAELEEAKVSLQKREVQLAYNFPVYID